VNLRGMTDYNVDIHCGGEVIGEIDPIGARGTLYKDAIYQHLGRRYMSMDLNLDQKLCRVEVVDVDYYTEAVWENRIEMTDVEEEKPQHAAALKFRLRPRQQAAQALQENPRAQLREHRLWAHHAARLRV
jgi:ATP-dependent helicase YprA (DUF1998 family)